MNEIKVKTKTHQYPIYLGYDIYKNLEQYIATDYSSILIITDENVEKLYLDEILSSLKRNSVYTKVVRPGEQSKTIDVFYELHTYLIEVGCDRRSLIIALGGGVVGDLAGFVAATYMRGIDYIQLPTTLLAHDSSVGGKVAINHQYGKNLMGSFYAPRLVVYDIKTLQSLPLKEIRSGYAELIKEALIADNHFFESLITNSLQSLNCKLIQNYIRKGITIKASIVEQDEKENGIRKHLNLGHTLGHALETYFDYQTITHGEAVAIGLLFSLYVSERKYNVSLPTKELLSWLTLNNYPLIFKKLNYNTLVKLMKADKKTINHSIHMVLLEKVGRPLTQEISDYEVELYLKSFFEKLGDTT